MFRDGSLRDFVVIALKHKRDGGFLEKCGGENLENCVGGMFEVETFFGDGDQGICGHGRPDLDFDGVRRGAKESLDTQVLLDPFEEQFDLPTLMIDGRDDRRRNSKIVCEENESLVDIGGVEADAAQKRWKCLSGVFSGEDDGLITTDAGSAINRVRLAAAK